MRNITLSFKIHHPFRFRKYRFFDIGNDSYYYDDFETERIVRHFADNYYLPANEIITSLLKEYEGKFKVAFSLSGVVLDQFILYAPEVIDSFKHISESGKVEFLGGTYAHSLASLKDNYEFRKQINAHSDKIKELFDERPVVFDSETFYSNTVGETLFSEGYKAALVEGGRSFYKQSSNNYIYKYNNNPEVLLLLKNNYIEDEFKIKITNAEKPAINTLLNNYIVYLKNLPSQEKIINIQIDFTDITKGQKKKKGVLNFLKSFHILLDIPDFNFMTPSEIIANHSSENILEIFANNDVKDLSLWLGNELQQEAFDKLYGIKSKIEHCTDKILLRDWFYLQSSDHFFYMCSDFFSNFSSKNYNPYNNPYEAFMNYMNILNDFVLRLNRSVKKVQKSHSYTIFTESE